MQPHSTTLVMAVFGDSDIKEYIAPGYRTLLSLHTDTCTFYYNCNISAPEFITSVIILHAYNVNKAQLNWTVTVISSHLLAIHVETVVKYLRFLTIIQCFFLCPVGSVHNLSKMRMILWQTSVKNGNFNSIP